ncbi:uncharacterized protein LOC131237194 [Magnolia sinica]|uniref:uncharacterized protein LOC131237194 n=1 Tax=Magnolia sinica TaxID=86752 RepID=UPI002658DC65|nr:uncharacterized protein LOC131237194 [Magnolia sinica]
MQAAEWKSLLILRNSVTQSSHFSLFHSTSVSLAKWKNKWTSYVERGQQPSKNHIRYATRQKRADSRKALKDLLFNSTSSKLSFQDEDMTWTADEPISRNAEGKQPRAKKSARNSKSRNNGNKRRHRYENFSDDYDGHPETIFQATFGGRCCTWSFKSWEDSHFQNSIPGFEWRYDSNWTSDRRRVWETSETNDDDQGVIGSYSDRTMLGLPPTGPLKTEDVKSAFHASALKWHPDKHQGPSQEKSHGDIKHSSLQKLLVQVPSAMGCNLAEVDVVAEVPKFEEELQFNSM